MRYMAGEIVEVHARYATRVLGGVEGLDVPDVQFATFQFASGAIGSLTTSCALTQGGGRSDLDFLLRDTLLHYTARELKVTPDTAPQPGPLPDPLPNIDAAFVQAKIGRAH